MLKIGCKIIYFISCLNTQATEEVSKNLASLKEILSGTGDKEPQTEAVAQLAQEFYNTDALILLVANLQKVDFEVGLHISASFALKIWSRNLSFTSCMPAGSVHFFFSLSGEEGCGSLVQQHRQAADWHPRPHGGIHLFETRNPLHASERVSFPASLCYMFQWAVK